MIDFRIAGVPRGIGMKEAGYCQDGRSKEPEYGIWSGMFTRCYEKTCDIYPYYGGRGIRVCPRWRSYDNFLFDMGCRPSESHSIDRIDNDKGYSPSNCRWATSAEQVSNQRPRSKRRAAMAKKHKAEQRSRRKEAARQLRKESA